MEDWIVIPVVAMFVYVVALLLEHREKMMKGHGADAKLSSEHEKLAEEHQEFVLGVDARIGKLEERIRLLEARLRQSGESGESQQVKRG